MSVEQLIRSRLSPLQPLQVQLTDDSAAHIGHAGARDGGHYRLLIVSEQFRSLSRLGRHRAVMDCVGDLIPSPVHALSVRAFTPDEAQ
jgi:BolA family transcriptional regulator, general stress-responsive regulator